MLESLNAMPDSAPPFCRTLWRILAGYARQPATTRGQLSLPITRIVWEELLEEVTEETETPHVNHALIKRTLVWFVAFNMIKEIAEVPFGRHDRLLVVQFLPSSEWSPALEDDAFTRSRSPLAHTTAHETVQLQLDVNAWEQARGYDRLAESDVFQADSRSNRDPRRMC